MLSGENHTGTITIKKLTGFQLRILTCKLSLLLVMFTGNYNAQNRKVPGEEIFTISCLKNIFVNVDVNDASAAMKVWAQQIEKKIGVGIKIDVKIFQDINQLVNYPQRDNLGIIMATSVDYLRFRSKMQVYPVFIPSLYDDYLVLVKNEKYKSLGDLKGKNLGLLPLDVNPLAGMWLSVLLSRNKLNNNNKFFGSTEELKSESQLILAVFFDKKDACLVSKKSFETMIELNPQVGKILKSLADSPVYLVGLSCFSRNSIKYSYIDKFNNVVLNLDSYPEGKQFMTLLKAEKMRLFKPENIEGVENLLKEFDAIPQKNKYKF